MMKNENTPITLVVPIHSQPEHRATIRKWLLELTRKTRQETGNIRYIPHDVPSDPNQFLIYEIWRDQSALDFHMEQDYLKCFLSKSAPLLAREIKGTLCEEMMNRELLGL